LWWGAPTSLFLQGKNEGLLQPYSPSFADQISGSFKDAENYFYGTFLTPVVLLWNKENVSEDEAPKDWDDLVDPKWKDRIVIRYPLASGTMRTAYSFAIWRSYKETKSPEEGYEWLRKLDANTTEYTAGSSIMYRSLETGTGDVSIWNLPDTVDQIEQGRPFAWTFPKSGTPVITDNIALVAQAPHPNAAKAFYEFVNTPLAQMFFAWRYARIPTRLDVPQDELPEWMRVEIPAAEVDWTVFSELGPTWMQYWDENIRSKGY
jgi:iron(III) transport system substrate-binding protein